MPILAYVVIGGIGYYLYYKYKQSHSINPILNQSNQSNTYQPKTGGLTGSQLLNSPNVGIPQSYSGPQTGTNAFNIGGTSPPNPQGNGGLIDPNTGSTAHHSISRGIVL